MHPLRALTDTEPGAARYVARAWLLAFLPSLAFFAIRVWLGNASLAFPAGPGMPGFAAYSIVVAPLLETALMMPLALALGLLPGASDWPRVVVLAALAALAHGIGGNAWSVAGAFWPFVVYAAALFAWQRRSTTEAYLVTALVHMLYNAAFFAVGIGGGLVSAG